MGGLNKPIVSCSFLITTNLNIFTITPFIKKARENVLEFLLTNHPLDCPICDQGGECDLQDLSYAHGSAASRFFSKKKNKASINLNSNVFTEMSRCILCTKCVRASFVHGISNLHTILRAGQISIEIFMYKRNLRFQLNFVDICPVFELFELVDGERQLNILIILSGLCLLTLLLPERKKGNTNNKRCYNC